MTQTSVRQLLDRAAPELFPLTYTQIKRLCDAVLASVDKEAVRALASRHSDGLPCEILSIERGSYNLSICLDFYNKISNRVLRIPLQPAVRDGWTKVQSEAATIE